jgi:hypothetical protein
VGNGLETEIGLVRVRLVGHGNFLPMSPSLNLTCGVLRRERYGSRSGERLGEHCEASQVGVQLDAGEAADASGFNPYSCDPGQQRFNATHRNWPKRGSLREGSNPQFSR